MANVLIYEDHETNIMTTLGLNRPRRRRGGPERVGREAYSSSPGSRRCGSSGATRVVTYG